MGTRSSSLYRMLPAVDEVLRDPRVQELSVAYGATATAESVRVVLTRLRAEIGAGTFDPARLQSAVEHVADAVHRELRQGFAASLKTVVNATGVVLHTNLGRAPLAQVAIERIAATAGRYSNLEFDIESGERGKRDVHVQRLFALLLNADEVPFDVHTVVVNNCAAAVLLALNSLAEHGEVIVSRGELVEIGGSFRVPEVMAKSQAVLREVGTTNRTRISDYERAINANTKLLLRVHRSNFAIVGFTEQPSLRELVDLGRKHKLPVLEDQGNGAMFDLRHIGVRGESGVAESLRAGVDVVTYSGDKLLGGPQAGMLSGRAEVIARIRSNPMFRALRVDKLTYAALEATLLEYLRGNHDAIPILRMMRARPKELRARAESLVAVIRNSQLDATVVESESLIGGGTAPTATLPTVAVVLTHADLGPDELALRLRRNDPAIVARVEEGKLWLDLRTVLPEEDSLLGNALKKL